jgi:hypothetical protein
MPLERKAPSGAFFLRLNLVRCLNVVYKLGIWAFTYINRPSGQCNDDVGTFA